MSKEQKTYGFPTDEKLQLKMSGEDVNKLITDILSQLGNLQSAVKNVIDHKYGPALSALLAVIQNLFVSQVLPHLDGNDAQDKPQH